MDQPTVTSDSASYDVGVASVDRQPVGPGSGQPRSLRAGGSRGPPSAGPGVVGRRSFGRTGVPCLLTTALPGQPAIRLSGVDDGIEQLADVLARIHDIDPTGLAPTDPHAFDEDRIDSWVSDSELAAATKNAARHPAERSPVLVHGDYQLFNLLWHEQKLSGVVD